ncbi:DUF1289 domain-containing protein [Amphibiibacter pelophylacis]|uniref:DUF1289 domain-containing protein n=1 Tax=Amphibiibacter pelophylacis TaxID=1799477 RepID=A0ACC6P1V0_9BURK
MSAADAPDLDAAPVASPCVGVCALDAQGRYCLGCWRSLDEIAAWSRASNAWRAQCVAQLPQRRAVACATCTDSRPGR